MRSNRLLQLSLSRHGLFAGVIQFKLQNVALDSKTNGKICGILGLKLYQNIIILIIAPITVKNNAERK